MSLYKDGNVDNIKCIICDKIGTKIMYGMWRCDFHYEEYIKDIPALREADRLRELDNRVIKSVFNMVDYRLYLKIKYWSPLSNSNIRLPYDMICEINKHLLEAESVYYASENRLPIKKVKEFFIEDYVKDLVKNKEKGPKNLQNVTGLKAKDRFKLYGPAFETEISSPNSYYSRYLELNVYIVKINNRYYVNKAIFYKIMERIDIIRKIFDIR